MRKAPARDLEPSLVRAMDEILGTHNVVKVDLRQVGTGLL